ncbi:hypothetical protein [Actinoplanes subglobosus]|uniref:Uncharacterized protein n=1 Tax=Actinoplanes subglobosus TaxID=1547892 RepID=A0ABV8IWC2_9ACTN
MGASQWNRKVPYQPDVDAALRQARREAYADGDYYRREADPRARQMSEEEYVAAEMAEERAHLVAEFGEEDAGEPDDTFSRDFWRAAQIDVIDPDSLLDSQPYSGTHSIIDMTGVAGSPEGGKVAPLPAADLDKWFGTDRPDAAAVERALDDGLDGFERWHGAYVIAYEGDRPAWIYFFGWSGD